MEMSGQSETNLPDQLTLFAADSPASLSVLPGSEGARRMTVTSGQKCLPALDTTDPLGLLAKMFLDYPLWDSNAVLLKWKVKSLLETRRTTFMKQYTHEKKKCFSTVFTKTLKKSVTKSNHFLFQLAHSVPRTSGTGSGLWRTPETMAKGGGAYANPELALKRAEAGHQLRLADQVNCPALWPTPQAQNSKGIAAENAVNRNGEAPQPGEKIYDRRTGKQVQSSLDQVMKLLPTPTTQDAANNGGPSQYSRNSLPLNAIAGGKLNPDWVEALMGFPPGWTEVGKTESRARQTGQKTARAD